MAKLRPCNKCEKRVEETSLRHLTMDGKRKRICQKCAPRKHMGTKKKNVVENTTEVPRDDLKKSMKLAMLRGMKNGLFTEEETLRALERMV